MYPNTLTKFTFLMFYQIISVVKWPKFKAIWIILCLSCMWLTLLILLDNCLLYIYIIYMYMYILYTIYISNFYLDWTVIPLFFFYNGWTICACMGEKFSVSNGKWKQYLVVITHRLQAGKVLWWKLARWLACKSINHFNLKIQSFFCITQLMPKLTCVISNKTQNKVQFQANLYTVFSLAIS